MAHILIADDDPHARGSIRRILQDAGHKISEAESGDEALAFLERESPDLVVLDIIMPGKSGNEVCRRIRSDPFHAHLPIIFLTAKSRPADIAAGLDAGGDDYITKPVEVVELPARVRALLRRTSGGAVDVSASEIVAGDVRLSLSQFVVEVAERRVKLSSTEHRLLYVLLAHAGQPLSIDRLLQDVWNYPPGVGDPALVYAHVKNLRRKIEPDPETPRYLRNVRGRGYLIALD